MPENMPDRLLKEAVIFDIDGTLANNEHRVHHLYPEDGSKKDWEAFFEDQSDDSVIPDVRRVLQMYNYSGVRIYILTGRGEEYRGDTVKWLWNYDIKYERLAMRPLDDRTNDDILKINQIKAWQAEGIKIVGLYDDRKRICDAARAHGITVFQMAAGDF